MYVSEGFCSLAFCQCMCVCLVIWQLLVSMSDSEMVAGSLLSITTVGKDFNISLELVSWL